MTLLNSALSRIFLVGFVIFFSGVTIWNSQLNHDTSWFLIATRWWIDGIPIYAQILELNPPLSFYIIAPPVIVAKVLGADPTLITKLYVFLLATVSIAWGHRLMQADGRLTPSQLTIMTTAVAIGFVIVPLGSIAQREHLMLLFAWPYVASMLVSDEVTTRKEKVLIGIFATFGLALKPVFLAIPLALTLMRMISMRKFSPALSSQNVTILGFCGVYVILAFLIHPAYFTEVIPKTLLVYSAYESDITVVFAKSRNLFILFIAIFLGIYMTPKTRLSSIVYGCAAVALAAFLFYNFQSKGWAYHMMPFRVLLWIFATVAVIALYSEARQKITGVVLGLLTVIMILVPALLRGPYKMRFSHGFEPFFQCEAGDRTFQVFGSNVSASYPMGNRAGALPAVRAPTLWLVPGVIHRMTQDIEVAERTKLTNILDEYSEGIIDDLLRVKPQLLIFDDREKKSYFHGAPFAYIAHFEKYERFRKYWSDYTYVDRFSNFEVYRREGC
jgi:hypothetical protein